MVNPDAAARALRRRICPAHDAARTVDATARPLPASSHADRADLPVARASGAVLVRSYPRSVGSRSRSFPHSAFWAHTTGSPIIARDWPQSIRWKRREFRRRGSRPDTSSMAQRRSIFAELFSIRVSPIRRGLTSAPIGPLVFRPTAKISSTSTHRRYIRRSSLLISSCRASNHRASVRCPIGRGCRHFIAAS